MISFVLKFLIKKSIPLDMKQFHNLLSMDHMEKQIQLLNVWKKNACIKHFPKQFVQETRIDENGYALSKCRNDGRTIQKNGVEVDNR